MATPIQTPVSQVPHLTAQSPASALPTDVATLQQMVLHLLGQINEKTRENFDLQCQLDWLKRQLFGRKSETMDPKQRLLFADLFDKLQQQLDQRSVPQAATTPAASAPKVPPANRPARRNGRVPLPAALPRVREYLDPDTCGASGRTLPRSWNTSPRASMSARSFAASMPPAAARVR